MENYILKEGGVEYLMKKNPVTKEITKEMIDAIPFDELIKDEESVFRNEKFLEEFFKIEKKAKL